MLEIVPTRSRTQAWRYIPRRLPSGETTLWDVMIGVAYVALSVRMFILRQKVAFIAYLWAWEYASHQPVVPGGRHRKPEDRPTGLGPRHVAPTPLLRQLGIVKPAWDAVITFDERVEAAARTA